MENVSKYNSCFLWLDGYLDGQTSTLSHFISFTLFLPTSIGVFHAWHSESVSVFTSFSEHQGLEVHVAGSWHCEVLSFVSASHPPPRMS